MNWFLSPNSTTSGHHNRYSTILSAIPDLFDPPGFIVGKSNMLDFGGMAVASEMSDAIAEKTLTAGAPAASRRHLSAHVRPRYSSASCFPAELASNGVDLSNLSEP